MKKRPQKKKSPRPQSQPMLEQAARLLSLGRSAEALPVVEQILRRAPHTPEAHHMLGFCHLQAGNLQAGIAALRTALRSLPNHAGILNHLGAALVQAGEAEEGIRVLKKAVGEAPTLVEARNNLAHALNLAGDHSASAGEYRTVIALAPRAAAAWQGLLSALHKSGDYAAALAAANEATARFADQGSLFASLGRIHIDLRQMDEAEKALRQALRLGPGDGEAANNLGTIVEERGNLHEALALYRIASECRPDMADAWFNLGNLQEKMGDLPAAKTALQRCAALRPSSARTLAALIGVRRKLCDWDGLEEMVGRLRTLVSHPAFPTDLDDVPSPFSVLSLMLGAGEHLRVARAYSNLIEKRARHLGAGCNLVRRCRPIAGRKIHIAYLSPDFREHPIAQLMAGVIEHHDRERFTVSCWSIGADDRSGYRARIARAADRFEDISGMDALGSAAAMRASQPDIVIDLAGYTAHARPEILAFGVAPVQVNYLGFPGSMGAAFVDYIIVDPVLVGEGEEGFYSEKVVRLPFCYQANDDRAVIDSGPMRRSEHGLPEEAFVFCSFSMNYKIDSPVLDAWAEILRRVPASVLWLYRTDAPAAANIQLEAQARGIDSARVIFADRMPKAAHLARHRLADLFLDTFAYGAHTTCSDALWAGLPALTLHGDTFARRVGSSIVRAALMPELVAASREDYIARAVEIGSQRALAESLKDALLERLPRCPLFSTREITCQLEEAYREMVRRSEAID